MGDVNDEMSAHGLALEFVQAPEADETCETNVRHCRERDDGRRGSHESRETLFADCEVPFCLTFRGLRNAYLQSFCVQSVCLPSLCLQSVCLPSFCFQSVYLPSFCPQSACLPSLYLRDVLCDVDHARWTEQSVLLLPLNHQSRLTMAARSTAVEEVRVTE
jgi:hypothetical protein